MVGGGSVSVIQIIQSLGLISDIDVIETIINDVITANAAIVAEFRAGKEKAFNSLVGKAMAASKGKANPAQVNELLRKKLGS
jgi:aspartyl-tRNA(Asn)/glutamyl-tRNA(Gln) amidotransferase subunit B